MRRTRHFLAFPLLLVFFPNTAISIEEKHSIQPEEYTIYLVLAQTLFIVGDTKQLIIDRRILENRVDDHNSISNKISWTFSELEPSTIDDYLQKSREAVYLGNLFQLSVSYLLIEPKEIDSLFKKGGSRWDAFYKKYPRSPGLLAFSRVGFNQEGDQALVYVNLSCGSLCGEGTWILLGKEAGVWAIRKKYKSAIS